MEHCKKCGHPLVYDIIEDTEIVWCPWCGKDYTYESREDQPKDFISRVKRFFRCHEVPGIR